MTKVVYNACYGGFGLSDIAMTRYWELKGETKPETWWDHYLDRADPMLVQVVEELGSDASDNCADLKIRNVPAGSLYRIEEYDGYESVVTQEEYRWKLA